MRKIVYFLMILPLLLACQQEQTEPLPSPISIDIEPLIVTRVDTAIYSRQHKRIKAELDYYLKRHSVVDEGYDMVARYNEQGDSLMAAYLPKGNPNILGMLKLRNYVRNGFGIYHNTREHYLYIGIWEADTLPVGLRIDTAGIYAGEFNRQLEASGHGCYSSYDGTFYEGHWENNVREGFGFMVSETNLQAGTWRKGKFHGERIQHTSDRIYGIDLSRYQHEKGRRRFGIDWSNLRVKGLGKRIKDNIMGEVDYPVKFVYIKSTQGTTIRNRYYATDYMAARRRNIPIGAYHFFSTVRSGKEQALYFLNHTLFKKGDLPPVIDIEPSDKQVQKMGGTAVLMREIRQWISAVERRLHVRPILYVNQRFVTQYLVEAPDLMENYLVWIARYGEYKPGLHLVMWQLSSDGKVNGIQTDVDVNVFNGYEPQWEEFLKEETIQ